MKKYLMSLAAIALVGSAFVSCSNKDDIVNVNDLTPAEKYKIAFETVFGKVVKTDANRTWGFENQTPLQFDQNGNLINAGALTRGVNANGNEWGLYVNVPEPLTQEQKDVVTEWFKANKNPQGVAVNWSDFFVQQVYQGEWGPNMNYLYCGSSTDHTNNFNAGTAGTYGNVCYGLKPGATDQNDRIYGSDQIEFMVNSSTEYFGFHNSFDSNFYIDNYVIIPGDRIDPIVAGMYFVGFDFEANGQSDNQKVARDFYFDNWIVKITPGIYKQGQRVFVEDLIAGLDDLSKLSISDWDFNDAVFDVLPQDYWDNAGVHHQETIITLRAAGGTLPLTVAGKEVHEMFGVNVSEMVNTGAGPERPVVIFRLDNMVTNANDIPVVLDGSITLQALEKNAETQKLAAPASVNWVGERVFINDVYKFIEWLQGNAATWYELR